MYQVLFASNRMFLCRTQSSVAPRLKQNKMKSSMCCFASKARRTSEASSSMGCDEVKQRKRKDPNRPMTLNQKLYCDYLTDKDVPIVIGVGKAGTGKTLLAASHAISSFYNKEVSKILITRPAVTLDEDHGFLPGKLQDKMEPYLKPLFDCFLQYYTSDTLKSLMKDELIEICPIAYIRGRTFHNSFIIADEMQNSTPSQMKTFLTRIGQNTKTAITGDLEQCDLRSLNGLQQFLEQLMLYNRIQFSKGVDESESSIKVVEFTEEDVQRSEVVKHVLSIYSTSPVDRIF